MKPTRKRRLRDMDSHDLQKRLNYLQSKKTMVKKPTREMKYIKYQLRKRGKEEP